MDWKHFFVTLRDTAPSNEPGSPPVRDAGRMKVQPPVSKAKTARKVGAETLSAVLGIVLALSLGAMLMMLNAPADFCFTMTAIVGLGGIVVHEVVTRRGWEALVSARLEDTAMVQEKLVREVTRNTAEIGNLKEGLAETAQALDTQAKRLPAAAASIESRMLNMISQRLGAIGKGITRAPKLQQSQDNPSDTVLDLELAPPPRKEAPVSKLEEALNPRGKKFSDSVLMEMVRNAVRNEKIEMYVQPVVTLPQRKAKMVELFARVKARSGITLSAERYQKIANDAMPAIDNWLLVHCLKALSDPNALMPGDLTCMLNIEASMLKNGQFMKELVGFLGKNKEMASRIVFELPQIEIDTLDPALVPVMHALTKAGCRFSMDSVRRRRINVTRLKSLNIRFLKLDGAWLIREAQQPGGAARVSRLKNQLDGAGIDLIVERIESEDELRELLDFHVDYGQGYLFARPEHYGAWRDRHFPPKKIGRVA